MAEAQLVRRRLLEDLIRRRKVLRRQIEQLRAGRERLLEAYEVVGQTVEEATAELGLAAPAAQAAAQRAGRRVGADDTVTEADVFAMEAEIDAARAAGLPVLDPPAEGAPPDGVGRTDEAGGPDEERTLFDRLRAADLPEVAPEPEAPQGPAPDPIEEPPSEEAVEPDAVALLGEDLARRLRRVLADEQNQVLDRLRQDTRGRIDAADLVADPSALAARLASAAEARLREATVDGGRDADVVVVAAGLADAVADGVHRELVERLGADAGAGDDLVAPVRAAFRAWRTDRLLPFAVAAAGRALG